MKKHILVLAIVTYTVSIFAQIGTHITSDRLPDLEEAWWNSTEMVLPWQNAGCLKQLQAEGGFEVTMYIDVIQDLPGVNLSQEITDKMDDNPTESILFYFQPGEYNFTETIEINRDNVVFKGAGADETTLKYMKNWYISIDASCQRFDFFLIDDSDHIGIEDLKLEVREPIAVGYPLNENYDGMFVKYINSNNCWLEGVHAYKAQRHHVYILNSHHVEIRGCYFNNIYKYNSGGNGYGIQVMGPDTKYCLIENNIFRKFRHAYVLNDEAHYNVFGYNYERDAKEYSAVLFDYIEGQICFHGYGNWYSSIGPKYNLCEGNIVGFIEIDDANNTNGEFNLVFRNKSYDFGIQVEHENDDQNIVNNYLVATGLDETLAGYPWIVHGNNHLKKNNKARNFWGSDWHDYSPEYWDDYSYYYESQPEFIPDEQWPYHPTNSDPTGDNNDNPAKDRWDAGGVYTVPAGSSNITTNCYVSGHVNIGNSGVEFIPLNGQCSSTTCNGSGDYEITIHEGEFGWFDIIYSHNGYYPITIHDVWINAPNYSRYLTLEDVTLYPISNNFVMVSLDQQDPQSFHNIKDAVSYLQINGGGTVYVLPGIYTGSKNKNINWITWDYVNHEEIHIKIKGLPTSSEQCIIDCEGGGIAFLFDDDDDPMSGFFPYNNYDGVENLTIQNAHQGIVIENGSPVIRNNIIENCETYMSYDDFLGVGISCKSSATIEDNIIQNNMGKWWGNMPSSTYGGGIYIENNSESPAIIRGNTIFNNCARHGGAIYCTGDGDIIIDDNWIEGNYLIQAEAATYSIGDGIGIYCYNCNSIEITNNIVVNNNNMVNIREALLIENCSNINIRNNTIVNNSPMKGIKLINNLNCSINNSIIMNNGKGIHIQSGQPDEITITYSCVYGNTVYNYSSLLTLGVGCFEEDPEINLGGDNPTYQPIWNVDGRSPCIDTGDPASPLDPDGTQSDIGAVKAVSHDFHLTTAQHDRCRYRSLPVLDRIYSEGFVTVYVCSPVEEQTDYFYIFDQDRHFQEWDGEDWSGNQLETLDSVKGYKLNTTSDVEIPTSGITLPDNTRVYLDTGRNWVGYFVKESMTIDEAFAEIWDHVESVISEDWAWHSPGIPPERCVLIYGKMYIVYVDEACDFVYGEGTPVPPKEREMTEGFYYVETPEYSPINIESLDDPTVLEVGVFLDGECIGANQVEEFPLQILAFTPEGGRGSGEITFEFYYGGRSYKPVNDYKVLNEETGQYVNSKIELRPYEFTTICFGNHPTPAKFTLSGNYPNPFNPSGA
ncbi:MAG: right-handed parallel beta-helix repeat-containing protein, partial [Candidatus Cloacimonetes bacterium]|nr:right-handed parallel beta-helix repeat-containing protein [Candidatus Cloacimonadota bacterium]